MITTKREIVSGDELTSKLKRGIDKLADTVKSTMGPKGKLVLIQRLGEHPIVTKDGVTVASAINLKDEVENLGAQIIKDLKVSNMILITKSTKKVIGLDGYGIKIVKQEIINEKKIFNSSG